MESYIKDIDECLKLLDESKFASLDEKLCEMKQTVYTDLADWQSIKDAAKNSFWRNPEYYQNDWVSDVRSYLRGSEDNSI